MEKKHNQETTWKFRASGKRNQGVKKEGRKWLWENQQQTAFSKSYLDQPHVWRSFHNDGSVTKVELLCRDDSSPNQISYRHVHPHPELLTQAPVVQGAPQANVNHGIVYYSSRLSPMEDSGLQSRDCWDIRTTRKTTPMWTYGQASGIKIGCSKR